MTEKTKVLGVRLPNEIKAWSEGYDMRRLIQSVYDLQKFGIIDIIDNEIVIPDNEMETERFEDIP